MIIMAMVFFYFFWGWLVILLQISYVLVLNLQALVVLLCCQTPEKVSEKKPWLDLWSKVES